ncbi:ficolin-2-like [Physella acuta]|uniref:ficolin-2-like n=1 Tax=Physella acuta TaxID=109671 RepID=UPI0027DD8201|nr:ficolin-2-like [Physella acuta]
MWFVCIAIILDSKVKVWSLDISTSVYHVYNQSEVLMLPLGKQFTNRNLAYCASQCLATNTTCSSFAYNKVTRTCSLGSRLIPHNNTEKLKNTQIYSVGVMCKSQTVTNRCCDSKCPEYNVKIEQNPVFDPFNTKTYNSCRDVISNEPRKVVTLTSGLVVMCDTVTDGGGWTIFQRRVSGTVDFYRGWEEYKHGFGDYDIGEFYLGNENIFCLTSKAAHELRVDLVYKGNFYAKYSSFKLSNESEGYKLSISGYSGNAGDSMSYQNNFLFTTFDKDNDAVYYNCAVEFTGAWWYNDCHKSNLNGQWGNKIFGQGMNWLTITDYNDNVLVSEMKIRTQA